MGNCKMFSKLKFSAVLVFILVFVLENRCDGKISSRKAKLLTFNTDDDDTLAVSIISMIVILTGKSLFFNHRFILSVKCKFGRENVCVLVYIYLHKYQKILRFEHVSFVTFIFMYLILI